MERPAIDVRGILLGRKPETALGRILRGRDVFVVFGLLLVAAETPLGAVPMHVGGAVAAALSGLHAGIAAGPTYAVTVVLGLYVQAVVVAAVYRLLRNGYRSVIHRRSAESS